MALVMFAVLACKAQPPTDDRPADQVDSAQLLREQKLVEKGEVVGLALQAPKVMVDGGQVIINGYRVASRSDLASADATHRITPVFDWARGLRSHWKTVHPAKPFTPSADVTLPGDVAFTDGSSLLFTLAAAGYADTMTVHCGDVTATIDIALQPPSDDPAGHPPPLLLELWSTRGAWSARSTTPRFGDMWSEGWGRDPRWNDADAGPPIAWCTVPRSITLATVAASSDCSGPCDGLVVGGADKLHDALAMVLAALSPTAHKPTVAFRTTSICEPTPITKTGLTMQQGSVTVNGRLPFEVVQRVVRSQWSKLRACYESALEKHATLAGTVSVKFEIDSTGAVVRAGDAGSDLPDSTVVQCVVKEVAGLSFPPPEGGVVSVVFPIRFAPP